MIALLRYYSWPEVRHHPWRTAVALLAITLGVALAFSVQLINQSALGEFSSALRSIDGTPDFELRGQAGGFDEALYARVARHAGVAVASPVVDVETYAYDRHGQRVALRVLGIDALVAGAVAPTLLPHVQAGADRFAALDPGAIFLNPQAGLRLAPGAESNRDAPARAAPNERAETGSNPPAETSPDSRADMSPNPHAEAGANPHVAKAALRVQTPDGETTLRIAGFIAASGPPLAVMDIAGAQASFGWLGRLSRIDVRLVPGTDRAALLRDLALPAGVRAAAPGEATERIANVSRAYRVNLTVLALVALFTGTFLVFSILSLSVAQRQPQLALLGVLGLGARERLGLVLAESALLGAVGSAFGLLLGTALAALALRVLGGDLGGGYFAGVAPALQFSVPAALVYGGLGIAAALVGGGLPAR
ncbi:MAG: FtsX-like permease family protein, partial [Caldimonas sp.]